MFEKVNPSHPDKVADRIAGALVDYCYKRQDNPKCAFEVLIAHGKCTIAGECSVKVPWKVARAIVRRIAGEGYKVYLQVTKQDSHLADNQAGEIRCGDNGIFKGVPTTAQQESLAEFARRLYRRFPTDGKFILADGGLIVCQSCATEEEIKEFIDFDGSPKFDSISINPLGDWTGSPSVDAGATNRKLGSDMGDAVTGGGLCGKDLSKADVSVNIYAFLEAQRTGEQVCLHCAIGDTEVGGTPYEIIVEKAKGYIESIGGFESFAEWGLIR